MTTFKNFMINEFPDFMSEVELILTFPDYLDTEIGRLEDEVLFKKFIDTVLDADIHSDDEVRSLYIETYIDGFYHSNNLDFILEEIIDDYGFKGIIALTNYEYAEHEDEIDFAKQFIDDCYDIDDSLKRYFNFQELGLALIEDRAVYWLENGHMIELYGAE